MSNNSRTVWSEGMFLGPHHFQQQDRYLLQTISASSGASRPYPYGLQTLEIDYHALGEGSFAILSCSGLFPDGTPFNLPQDAPLPDPIKISMEEAGAIISIGLPFESHAEKDIAEIRSRESFSRFQLQDQQVSDRHSPDSDSEETVFTASLWTRLLVSDAGDTAYHSVPIARIEDCRDDGTVVLSRNFFPCADVILASAGLLALLKEIDTLLSQRASDLASHLGRPDSGDTTQLTQFFMLQIINRAKPLFEHILNTPAMQPERIYSEMRQIAGELATFCSPTKQGAALPAYNHRDQYSAFYPLAMNIRENLNFTVDQKVVPFPVEHIKGGIYTANVTDTSLFRSARFILAVSTRLPPDEIRQQFTHQTTISSKDKLRDLVTSHTAGVALNPVVQVPNNIPMYDQHVYFEFDRNSALWSEIAITGIIALHIAGNFPDLKMQLWTLNQ